MNKVKVLCVDDEKMVLEGLFLQLRQHYDVHMAISGDQGLEMIEQHGPFAVVLSDMRMPGMNGATFLSMVRQKAPNSVRMLLTGQTDINTAIAAVNEGQIFRFMAKPCPREKLLESFEEGVKKHNLILTERDILDRIANLPNPTGFDQALSKEFVQDPKMVKSKNPFEDDLTGVLLLNRYRLVRQLARGGMGVVYLARAEGAAGFVKPVAVKLILPCYAGSEEHLGMFIREARILSNLQDPGIINVVDFAEENGCYVLVLEYIHGFQLIDWVKYLRSIKKRISTKIVIKIILSVLDSLHHAHTVADSDGEPLHIVHRDISPSNIMLDLDGHTKIVDFGISLMTTNSETEYQTQTTSFKGKLSYGAPEMFSNRRPSVQSDVYSCGVTLHELLVGKNEFLSKTPATTIYNAINHIPSSAETARKDAPKGLDSVVAKALAKDPDERFQSAAEFAGELRKVFVEDELKTQQLLARSIAATFTKNMTDYLGVESLKKREQAWQNPSTPHEEFN